MSPQPQVRVNPAVLLGPQPEQPAVGLLGPHDRVRELLTVNGPMCAEREYARVYSAVLLPGEQTPSCPGTSPDGRGFSHNLPTACGRGLGMGTHHFAELQSRDPRLPLGVESVLAKAHKPRMRVRNYQGLRTENLGGNLRR